MPGYPSSSCKVAVNLKREPHKYGAVPVVARFPHIILITMSPPDSSVANGGQAMLYSLLDDFDGSLKDIERAMSSPGGGAITLEQMTKLHQAVGFAALADHSLNISACNESAADQELAQTQKTRFATQSSRLRSILQSVKTATSQLALTPSDGTQTELSWVQSCSRVLGDIPECLDRLAAETAATAEDDLGLVHKLSWMRLYNTPAADG